MLDGSNTLFVCAKDELKKNDKEIDNEINILFFIDFIGIVFLRLGINLMNIIEKNKKLR
jgi:hypothetical protein